MPYRTLDNRIDGVAVTFSDISVQKEAASALKKLNVELEARVNERTRELGAERDFSTAVFETAAALVVVLDRDGRIVRCNKACERLCGYSADDLCGQPIAERLLLPEEKDDVLRVLAEVRDKKQPTHSENHWRCRDSSARLIAWSNTFLLDDAGEVEYIVKTGIDVTEQRRSEEEVRERRVELAHLHRVYTAGEFAAVMAHELNQPLAAIASYSEAGLQSLRRGEIDQDAMMKDLEQIGLQAQRAGRSIRELRRFLSRDEQTREQIDMNEVLRAAERLLAPEARARDVDLILTLSATPLTVVVAPIQLEHVVVNLARNAIEAIHSAGREEGTITIRTFGADHQAHVTVQDNGPGFDDAGLARLFERFYTTKSGGLGMGLAICRGIVESHHGKISAERPTEGGALFHVTLPLQSSHE